VIGVLDLAGGDPAFAWLGAQKLILLVALLPVAVVVFWFGRRQQTQVGGSLRPRGRSSGFGVARGQILHSDRDAEPSPIATASAGDIRLHGRIVEASGHLGGAPGRECIFRNRVGARPQSAVAAETMVIADETGRALIEGLQTAVVIARPSRYSPHHEHVSLHVGDEVEVSGRFVLMLPLSGPSDRDPSARVYGTLHPRGSLEVRLLEPPRPSTREQDPS